MRNAKSIPLSVLLTLALSVMLSACKVLPVVPTFVVIPTRVTDTLIPPTTASALPTNTFTDTPTLPPTITIVAGVATFGPLPSPATSPTATQVTYGPVSLSTSIPSPTLAVIASTIAPTIAPTVVPTVVPTSPPTLAATEIPIEVTKIANSGGNAVTFIISELQLNAALTQAFSLSPILGYSQPPRVTLSEGSLDLSLDIVPANIQVSALPMTLTTGVVAYEGALETRPTHLTPLDAGVTTRQVKPGETLLRQAFEQLARQAANAVSFTYAEVVIHPEGVTVTLATTAR